jgi:hypothetical protein
LFHKNNIGWKLELLSILFFTKSNNSTINYSFGTKFNISFKSSVNSLDNFSFISLLSPEPEITSQEETEVQEFEEILQVLVFSKDPFEQENRNKAKIVSKYFFFIFIFKEIIFGLDNILF